MQPDSMDNNTNTGTMADITSSVVDLRAGHRGCDGLGIRSRLDCRSSSFLLFAGHVDLAEGPDTVGAMVLEPVVAGGGVIPPPEGYWETVQEICKKYDILLHIDEVVCGVGRTGTWFGYQHYGIKPDFVTMAKGVASGYAAIACMVTTEDVFNMFKDDASDPMSYFRDISTFGGCTAGPAAAIENMRIIEDEGLLENTVKMGERTMNNLRALMEKHRVIGDVRGRGLMLAIELGRLRLSLRRPDETDEEGDEEDINEATMEALVGAETGDGSVSVTKEFWGGITADYEVQTPAVLGIQAARQAPRYVAVSLIRQAQQGGGLSETDVDPPDDTSGVRLVAVRVPESGEGAEMIHGDEEEAAAKIMEIIRGAGV